MCEIACILIEKKKPSVPNWALVDHDESSSSFYGQLTLAVLSGFDIFLLVIIM